MRVSYGWLRELLPGLGASPSEVAERLTAGGLEIESISDFGAPGAVVVAAVRRIEPHPTRERLRLVTVDTGAGEHRIVCGAANVPAPGGLVALAPLGTHLPAAGVTLEARAIGGVDSAGMLCSEAELGLAEASDGILVLPEGAAPPGTPLARAVAGAHDTIFEVGITPNRADALGHVGVARDLAALLELPFAPPGPGTPARTSDASLGSVVDVRLDDPERCPIYGAAVVDEVTIGPSPPWLRYRLHALGVRPISNVVDVTNLLLLEFGQPLHAFDAALVSGGRIVVRRAAPDEPFTTLDGVARKLDADDLVICDARGPIALAGVMGGQNSEIREATRRVVLECAYFRPRGIRRTSRRHALSTESSYRFERGVDWGAVPVVLERAKVLLTELAGGAAIPSSTILTGAPLERPRVRLRGRRLDELLGIHVPFEEATRVLSRLGLTVKSVTTDADGPAADVEGASFRPDLTREADLIEEVARVRGLDEIPTVLPSIAPSPPRPTARLERSVLTHAANLGLSEAVTYSFVSERELAAVFAPAPVVALKNPMSEERSVLRTSLLPGLLDVLGRARRHGERSARLFAVGSRFLPPGVASDGPARPRAEADRRVLPEERPSFAAVLAGARPAHLEKPRDVDVLDAKGLVVELVERLTGQTPSVEAMAPEARLAHLHPRGAAWISLGTTHVGSLGPLHPDVVDALDLDGTAMIVELDLVAIESAGPPEPRYRPIPRLPATSRDVALVVHEGIAAAEIERQLRAAAGNLCESVELFDVFSGGAIPEGFRSLAYRLVYRDPRATTEPDAARTLTDEEVDREHERVRDVAKRLGELRS